MAPNSACVRSDDVRIKICGLRETVGLAAAVDAGASYIGLNFFPKSPRSVSVAQAAALALEIPMGVAKVALVVNPVDTVLDDIIDKVAIDIIQLHGHETPERVMQVRARYGLPVMKAVGVAGPEDIADLDIYGQVADMLLVDAKPPKNAAMLGGNGVPFDWRLIAGRRWPVPWLLAGGLTAENVSQAVDLTGARQVDLSSGVESAPGVKDPAMIAKFCAAAHRR